MLGYTKTTLTSADLKVVRCVSSASAMVRALVFEQQFVPKYCTHPPQIWCCF